MTDTPTTPTAETFVVHGTSRTGAATLPAVVSPFGEVTRNVVLDFGQEMEVSPELVEASRDRLGNSPFDLDDDAQIKRWGEIKFRRGPWPADQSRLLPGSDAWLDAREAAQKAAWATVNPAERAAGRQAVRDDFGQPAATSRTLTFDPSAG